MVTHGQTTAIRRKQKSRGLRHSLAYPTQPHRTALPLLRIEHTNEGEVLVVAGSDLLDGTPIYDIKPYIAQTDAIPDTRNGFVDDVDYPKLQVIGLREHILNVTYEQWEEILSQDPRPAYQHDKNKIYHLIYNNEEATFRVEGNTLIVEAIKQT